MAAAVAILDALRKKPVAEKKKQFSVAFFVASLDKPNERQEEPKEQKEQTEPKERQEEQEERFNQALEEAKARAAAVDLANFIESASSIPGTHHSEPLPANTHRNNTGNDNNSATEHTCSNQSIKDP